MSYLGEALRRERHRRGEKQRQTAQRFGVSQPSYHRWESGVSLPADEQRHLVAEFLGVTVQELWEMIHEEAPPVTLEELQQEMSAVRRDIQDLKTTVGWLTDALEQRSH